MKRTLRTGARAIRNGNRTAAMAAEVPAAAFVTIAHRLPMIFAAAIEPRERANPELSRMVHEKVKAATQSATAMSQGVAKAGQAVSQHFEEQGRAGAKIAAAPIVTTPAAAAQLFWRQAQANLSASALLTVTLFDVAAGTAAATLSPMHKKVAANAKRLSAQKTTAKKSMRPRARKRPTPKA